MKKGFTLVEVLFSAVLIGIIGLALLKTTSNNTKLIHYNSDKKEFNHLFSIFANNMNEKLHNKSKTFYDLIDKKYSLDDDTRKKLKETKYDVKSVDIDSAVLEENSLSDQSFLFTFRKNSINGQQSGFIYEVIAE